MKKSMICNILKVFAIGAAAAGIGIAGIGLAVLAAAIYCTIPATGGYAAVALFALATLAAAAALFSIYICGCWILHKGKFSI